MLIVGTCVGVVMIESRRERMVKLATRIAELREELDRAENEMQTLLDEPSSSSQMEAARESRERR